MNSQSEQSIKEAAIKEIRQYTDKPIYFRTDPIPSNHLLTINGVFCDFYETQHFVECYIKVGEVSHPTTANLSAFQTRKETIHSFISGMLCALQLTALPEAEKSEYIKQNCKIQFNTPIYREALNEVLNELTF